jgi:hypothetical protein
MADSIEELKTKLEDVADRFSCWAKGNGLAMNAGKTQLLVSSNAGSAGKDLIISIEGRDIAAANVFELLGVSFDRKFSTAPHDKAVAAATKQRASLIRRLTHHLPRGDYLRQLGTGLVCGKIAHALAAVNTPRMAEADGGANEKYKAVQISLNNVARSIVGSRISDRIPVPNLLRAAGLPSVNAMTASAVAMEAWRARWSSDGDDGAMNPIGDIIFGYEKARNTQADTRGVIPIPLRGYKSLVNSAATVWNSSLELRSARTKGEARRAAAAIAGGVPV